MDLEVPKTERAMDSHLTTEVENVRPFRRILLLTQYYSPESGAPPVRLGAMARELSKLGFQVRVLTGMPNYPTGVIHESYRGKFHLRETLDNIPVRRVWLYPAAGRNALKRLANYLSFNATSALALLSEPPADILFVEAQPVTLAVAAWINTLVRGTPYVYNTPDLQVEYANEDRWFGGRLLAGAARSLEGFLMKRALTVTTVTHAFMEHFHEERGIPRRRLSFLPNGADTERLRPLARDTKLAEKMGVGDRKVFTFAGTHAPYQGLHVLLEAAKLLRHRSDIVFLMVGNGPLRQPLIEQAERENIDNVLFRSSPFEEMRQLMSITHASLVLLRALAISKKMRLSKAIPPLACGVPLIYAGWGETAEIVEREGVGLAVEPEQPVALALAVERLADEPGLRDTMGAKGRALAEKEFSWSFLVKDWVRQIERIQSGQDPAVPGL
jgi:colanic acid biosynthesis glycosyl transferase WcaI